MCKKENQMKKTKLISIILMSILVLSSCTPKEPVSEQIVTPQQPEQVVESMEITPDDSITEDTTPIDPTSLLRTKEEAWSYFLDHLRYDTDGNYIIDDPGFTVDFSSLDSFENVIMDGDKLLQFTVPGAYNDKIRFECKGLYVNSEGQVYFKDVADIYTLDELGGISYFEVDLGECEEAYLELMAGPCVSLEGKTNVDSSDDYFRWLSNWCNIKTNSTTTFYSQYEANFYTFQFKSGTEGVNVLNGFSLWYTNTHHEYVFSFDTEFYGSYITGSYYDATREHFSLDKGDFTFYLQGLPDCDYKTLFMAPLTGVENFKVGDLYDANGNIKDKEKDALEIGDCIEVIFGEKSYMVTLPVRDRILLNNQYERNAWGNSPATGDQNVLVIPLVYNNMTDLANDEFMDNLHSVLGKTIDSNGNVTEYTIPDNKYPTFTEYFYKSSYGNLNLNCFVTDYCVISKNFSSNGEINESVLSSIEMFVNANYANLPVDFDTNNDNVLDNVIIICPKPGDEYYEEGYNIISNMGAFCWNTTDGPKYYDNNFKHITNYTFVNMSFLQDKNDIPYPNTLIHEYSHLLGLIDYYDVTYSGINAVGGFDMQSDNIGEWNPSSKFSAGWIKPTVLTADDIGDGIDITINAYEENGDTIIITTDKDGFFSDGALCPFSEYIAVSLYTPTGLYAEASSKFGLNNPGVLIYHADNVLSELIWQDAKGNDYTLGDVYRANAYNLANNYYISLISKTGKNVFTNPQNYRNFNKNDLFYAGDSFSMETHKSFFNNSLMNNRDEFPFKITVKSIQDGQALIHIE